MTESSKEPTDTTMSKEDKAFYVRNLWESLITPICTKDDLIELGKAVFAKVPLSKLDDKTFNRLFPLLVKISEILGSRIRVHIIEELENILKTTVPRVEDSPAPATVVQPTPTPATASATTPAPAPTPAPTPAATKPQPAPVPAQNPASATPTPPVPAQPKTTGSQTLGSQTLVPETTKTAPVKPAAQTTPPLPPLAAHADKTETVVVNPSETAQATNTNPASSENDNG